MSSPDDLAQPLQMIVDNVTIEVDLDATPPFEASTGEKRKREGKVSKAWQHFTRLEKKPGGREECRCNHCGQLYACSSKSGTGHLNRHIFEGRCPNFKPSPEELISRTPARIREKPEDTLGRSPTSVDQPDSLNDNVSIDKEEVIQRMEMQLSRLKNENTKLQKEKDALVAQRESLEQLLVTMASETGRLTEENTKLKEDFAKLEEEKQRVVTREEFMRLEGQVSRLREEFNKDRQGLPTAVVTALKQINRKR